MIKYQIAGVDEAGRGPLAGPVVASAVILNKCVHGITDSKKLSAAKRQLLADLIMEKATSVGIGICSPAEIDAVNIHVATLNAMQRAIEKLEIPPKLVLVDGKFLPETEYPSLAIIKGDLYSNAIGAASIIAKTTRDKIMLDYAEKFPEYGFELHKGYPTKRHIEVLENIGPSPLHRNSFAPVRNILQRKYD